MAAFLTGLLQKFFDFFNFGRFLSIFLPGLIVTLAIGMLADQIIAPVDHVKVLDEFIKEHQPSGDAKKSSKLQAKISSQNPKVKKATRPPAQENQLSEMTDVRELLSKKGHGRQALKGLIFERQLIQNYGRVMNNWLLIVIGAIVIGVLMHEVGYLYLLCLSKCEGRKKENDKYRLYPYAPTEADKIEFIQIVPASTHGDKKKDQEVGFVYFAPFLKEKISGDENYFTFLITEYYRFVEFCINMPLSLILTALVGIVYILLFNANTDILGEPLEHLSQIWIMFGAIIGVSLLFLFIVTPKVLKSYFGARADLIRGVSDYMNKTSK